jgi:hypothetical protein
MEWLGSGMFGEVWRVFDRALNVERAVNYAEMSRIHDASNVQAEPLAFRRISESGDFSRR